jgi:hypothetical protein
MLESLTRFTVVPEYHRSRTLYHVHVKGTREPVAQARIERAPDTWHPFQVFTGQGLDQLAGWVSSISALGPDKAKIGEVSSRYGALGKEKWTVTQYGLPELQGGRAGVAGALRDGLPVVRGFLIGGVADAALSAHLRFSAQGCAGFEFTRQPGIRTKFRARVHDDRISGLLVLAAILNYDSLYNADLRKEISEISANPFKI